AGHRALAAYRLRPCGRDREESASRGQHPARGGVASRIRQGRGLRSLGAARSNDRPVRKLIVALISGRGSNLQALLDSGLPVSGVISNRSDAKGLELAAARSIATRVVEHRAFASREAFDAALAAAIDRFAPRLVALAGFMRVLGAGFVERYAGR